MDSPRWKDRVRAMGVTDGDILKWAREIEKARIDATQCSTRSNGDDPVRCELPPGHPPYVRGEYRDPWAGKTFRDDKPWDHAAPVRGVYWMNR